MHNVNKIKNFVLARYHDLTKRQKNITNDVDTASVIEAPVSSTEVKQDTVKMRQNPYDIRGDKAEKRTINIVKDKPVKAIKKRR